MISTTTERSPVGLEPSPFLELEGLYVPWPGRPVAAPDLVVLNEPLARALGLDPDELRRPEAVAVLAGNQAPAGVTTIAQAYAGHQFGGLSPQLGDGRALLLGDVVDPHGGRRDVHLKGSGPTPFARGGDGRAALGPMLREYVMGEAMHALGIPTTRALAVVATGEPVVRETLLPGAVLVRVAASHVRVGTFQYASLRGDPALVRRLADHAIARLHPTAAGAAQPYVALFDAVVAAQAALVAQWMLVGFIHGVMNTDNMTISGETIDYGPCAFMDTYDPATVFSSIDHGGRYAYGNQPRIAQWNLARLGETLLPLFDEELDVAVEAANAVLATYPPRFQERFVAGMRAKLGLQEARPDDEALVADLLALLETQRADGTSAFRALAARLRGDQVTARAPFVDPAALEAWATRWDERRRVEGRADAEVAAAMDSVNPRYIPRNHRVEEALDAAVDGDREPLHALLAAVTGPFDERPGLERYAGPAPAGGPRYQTFCGT